MSDEAAAQSQARHTRRLAVRRIVLAIVVLGLAAWLIGVALSPASGPLQRVLLLVLAVLLPLHLVVFQYEFDALGCLRRLNLPRVLKTAIALVVLAASPMGLYPLGLAAIAVSLFSGGSAAPALAVTGFLVLSPILAIVGVGLLFAISRPR